ncbi:AAA family ATPase [Algoriphagus zhangzhouensis]|uniref:UvrD-like helicase C-terminal domain-containing protein n=1 Tax=Algoriphagus zhangzhouensis TaxID=1073327 RepID=A0A1M7Z503_9BACT|nr:AAA family ATPase [Algoriphagus zhangzhouensis]TDY48768.1 UvrD-like helicase family protein [Algoriphagus zhangzhouensis]SHO59924.1 UvrD-like helicase C-terminal domain-containing protein [Algoriphagus zhangzhouensis]
MKKNPRYSLKHLSVRVPWHDNRWNGTVCNSPGSNGACLILRNCALNRDDENEKKHAGESLEHLDEKNYPVCVGERATFMAPFAFYKTLKHPYIKSSPSTHGHLKPTSVRFPSFSAAAVPYLWMLKGNAEEKNELFDLGFNKDMEPELDWQKGKQDTSDNWIQESGNQKAMLNCFFEHLDPASSLILFYAKQVPFVEDSGRVLIGVGRIKDIKESELYDGSNKKFSAAYWEHMIHHSIRDDFKDGFLLPYHDAIEFQKEHPDFDPAELAVITPSDKVLEFSYGSEHVSSDSAIRTLLLCSKTFEKANELGIGKNNDGILQWIHDRVHELEKLRGDYPGMGAALCALGLRKGHFIAAEIINSIKENENPWLKFDEALENPSAVLSDATASELTGMAIKTYQRYHKRDDKSRLHFLYLLSRFDITQQQAEILWSLDKRAELTEEDFGDKDFLENPYLIYQITRRSEFPVDLSTIDLGLYTPTKGTAVLPDIHIKDALDERRLKAMTIILLENGALAGHTLLPRKDIINKIHEINFHPLAKPNSDHMEVAEDVFASHIHITEMKNGEVAYQLDRLKKTQEIINAKVKNSLKGDRLAFPADWRSLLDEELSEHTKGEPDEEELKAREEKAAALKEIAESRFSVLIGPAGTGKTTLLSILAKQSEIKGNGVLFLAPTGKARVRMEELSQGTGIKVTTVAQFLLKYHRFNGKLQQYKLSDEYCEGTYQTVILDESSMVTEEMMATLMNCFKGVKRFILVGDHRQLPPIGPGRPFRDIIQYLLPEDLEKIFPKVGAGYAELTVRRRQGGTKREDLQLAEWFSGNALGAGEDQIINDILSGKESQYLKLVSWKNEEDFDKQLEQVLSKELNLKSTGDPKKSFNISLGSSDGSYFNSTKDALYRKLEPSINRVEDWQVLSPVREKPFGVKAINRKLHKQFRQVQVDYVSGRLKKNDYDTPKLPKALGTEEVVYGDKVINLSNHRRTDVYPDNGMSYIANGEIGLVVGQFKSPKVKGQPKFTHVEFSSQKGFTYTFKSRDFKEEGNSSLELAYAITVHKSQGSEFGKVFLIIPDPCFLLTREMLYTALTRQKDKVIVLYQGDAFKIKELSSPIHSDTLSRITNLFEAPDMVEKDGKYLEKNLIHQASDGKLLRSKSELLIYQQFINHGIEALYEKDLVIREVQKLPDFTIMDEYSDKVYYWEHCGMMHDKEYRERWADKCQWYRDNDILPIEEGGGKNGILIATYDTPVEINGKTFGAFSLKEVDEFIKQIKG